MNINSGLRAVFEQVGDDYVGYIEKIPSVNTQGALLDEVKGNLLKALEMVMGGVRN